MAANININVSPTAGNACVDTPAALTFSDGGGQNYGRTSRVQKFVIKTFGDSRRTSPLGADLPIWVEHLAADWRILQLKTSTSSSAPTGSDFNSITKTIPTSSSTSAPNVQLGQNTAYWVYGISNGETITIDNVDASKISVSDAGVSANKSTWQSKTITGAAPTLTVVPGSDLGENDVYYFRFKVTILSNTGGTSTTVYASSSSSTSGIVYTVTTTEQGTVSWSAGAALYVPASSGSSSDVTCTNGTSSPCNIVYTQSDIGYVSSPNPSSVAAGQSATLSLHANQSNYDTYTTDGVTYLKSASKSERNLGSLDATNSNHELIQRCTVKQSPGQINRKVFVVNGDNNVSVNVIDRSGGSVTVDFTSQAYNSSSNDGDGGVQVWVQRTSGSLPTPISDVTVDNATKKITFTIGSTHATTTVRVGFEQCLYNNGVQTWPGGETIEVAITVNVMSLPTIGVLSLDSLTQISGNHYTLTGKLTTGILSSQNALNGFRADLNYSPDVAPLYLEIQAGTQAEAQPYRLYRINASSGNVTINDHGDSYIRFDVEDVIVEVPQGGRNVTVTAELAGTPQSDPAVYQIMHASVTRTFGLA